MDRLNVVETDTYRKFETEIKEILTKYPGKYLMFKILKEYLIISNWYRTEVVQICSWKNKISE